MSQEEIATSDDRITPDEKILAVSDNLMIVAEQLISISLMLRAIAIKYSTRPQKRSSGAGINSNY